MLAQSKRLLLVFLLAFSAHAIAQSNETSNDESPTGEPRYITDNLYTFIHSGPGRNYRILGSVSAGAQIMQLQVNSDGSYIEIVDDKNRQGWVDARHITEEASLRTRLPALQESVDGLNGEITKRQVKIDELNKIIEKLESEKVGLKTQYDNLLHEHEQTQQSISKQTIDSERDWFIRGGLLALAGVIVGVVITYLPKRRKRNDTWM